MKKIIKIIIDIPALLLSLVFNYYTIRAFSYVFKRVYAFAMMRTFGEYGNNFRLDYPCTIINGKHITVGDNFEAKKRLYIEAVIKHNGISFKPSIVIGNNVSINNDVHIGCCDSITIGNNVLIGSKILITDHDHGDTTLKDLQCSPGSRILKSKGPVVIEDNVWIGEGAVILSGVTVGNNSIIGANAVVTTNVPPFSIAVGNPIRIIRRLQNESETI